jgi:hypothetical protein
MFRERLAERLPELKVPQAIWKKDWVVHCKPTVQGPEKVLRYLGRYVHRVAITNRRILSVQNGQVTFRYSNARDGHGRTLTLPAQEFIRRFLQHVLPAGVHKVRYYGLWNPAQRTLLRQLHLLLAPDKPLEAPCQPPAQAEAAPNAGPRDPRRCPSCGQGLLVWKARIPRQPRAPP